MWSAGAPTTAREARALPQTAAVPSLGEAILGGGGGYWRFGFISEAPRRPDFRRAKVRASRGQNRQASCPLARAAPPGFACPGRLKESVVRLCPAVWPLRS